MASHYDPWWANTWWGKRTTAVNVAIAVGLALVMLWTALGR